MILYYEQIMGTFIFKIDLSDKLIESICNIISQEITQELKSNNWIVEDSGIQRCHYKGDGYFTIDPHANFRSDRIHKLVEEMCELFGFEKRKMSLYSNMPEDIKQKLPYFNVGGGWQAGGTNNDESGIDEHIFPLVEVLNQYEGLETFSSCDGHYKTSPYILWYHRDNNMNTLHKVLLDLTDAGNDVLYDLKLSRDIIGFDLTCEPDLWTTKNPDDEARQSTGISRTDEFYSGPVFQIILKLNWEDLPDKALPYEFILRLSKKLLLYQNKEK